MSVENIYKKLTEFVFALKEHDIDPPHTIIFNPEDYYKFNLLPPENFIQRNFNQDNVIQSIRGIKIKYEHKEIKK